MADPPAHIVEGLTEADPEINGCTFTNTFPVFVQPADVETVTEYVVGAYGAAFGFPIAGLFILVVGVQAYVKPVVGLVTIVICTESPGQPNAGLGVMLVMVGVVDGVKAKVPVEEHPLADVVVTV